MATDFIGLQPEPELIGQAAEDPRLRGGREMPSTLSTSAKPGDRGQDPALNVQGSEQVEVLSMEELFVASALFETGCGVIILLSVLAIAWEMDDVFTPQFRQFLESGVTSFFLVEWIVRLKANGKQWLLEPVVMFDTFLVWVPGVLAVWILQPSIQDGATDFLKLVRTIRMLRLLRIVLFFKHFKAFQDLFKLVRGLLSSGSTLLSAMGLIAATLYTFAIFAIDLIGNQDFTGAGDDVLEAQGMFQGLFTTMITLMRFMHGDDCQGILDVLTTRQPWIWVFLWLFTSLSSYVLLNLVTAVIVQQALEMSSADEADLALQMQQQREEDMRELETTFRTLDEDQSGQVSLEEFMQAFKIKEVKTKLTLLGLKEAEMLDLFRLLDTDGEGELSLDEFMQGMSQLKGEARNKDMLLLEKSIERLGAKLHKLEECDPADLEFKNAFDTETGARLRQTFEKIRDNIDERLTQAEAEVQEVVDFLSRLSEEFAALPPGLDVKKLLAQEDEPPPREQLQASPASGREAPSTQRGSFVGSLVSESTMGPSGAEGAGRNAAVPVQRGSLLSESTLGAAGSNAPVPVQRGSLFSEASGAGGSKAPQLTQRGSLFSDPGSAVPSGAGTTRRGSLFSDASAAQPRGNFAKP
ncbi:Cacna1h [Symbiodinium natans]|uniref:Cacna1h protein n=1 Tax=Symbiodinium natans TaxID=878477 RepID=A0A812Q885_9DINO|nr:Cacna1h [Symbiodinium natans]